MTVFAIILALLVGVGLAIGRALVVDEAKGRLRRSLRATLERTIAGLPPALRDEWEEDWLAELEAAQETPITAVGLVWGLRKSAIQLAAEFDDAVSIATNPREPHRRSRSSVGVAARLKRWRSRIADLRAQRIERRWVLAHEALTDAARSGPQTMSRRVYLRARAFVRFSQADVPYVFRTMIGGAGRQSQVIIQSVGRGTADLVRGSGGALHGLSHMLGTARELGRDLLFRARQPAPDRFLRFAVIADVLLIVVAAVIAVSLLVSAWP